MSRQQGFDLLFQRPIAAAGVFQVGLPFRSRQIHDAGEDLVGLGVPGSHGSTSRVKQRFRDNLNAQNADGCTTRIRKSHDGTRPNADRRSPWAASAGRRA